MSLFDRMGVAHVIHCGDIGGVEVFDELAGRPCTFVWGNTDVPNADLMAYLRTVGLAPPHEIPTRLALDGRTFAVLHGHEPGFNAALALPNVDYILHGHTHIARDDSVNGKRIINPGALNRAKRKTVATLDPAAGQVQFHEVADR
jgi:predicted phosphodiesterase